MIATARIEMTGLSGVIDLSLRPQRREVKAQGVQRQPEADLALRCVGGQQAAMRRSNRRIAKPGPLPPLRRHAATRSCKSR